jgi:putative effector of murein hydrolase LrgA (UPF0299 family)
MLTFAISLLIMFAVVGASVQWASRAERRRNMGEDGHGRDH